eukprot:scaffold104791_cov20-Prasinocladus_malaysianus.AAC.1
MPLPESGGSHQASLVMPGAAEKGPDILLLMSPGGAVGPRLGGCAPLSRTCSELTSSSDGSRGLTNNVGTGEHWQTSAALRDSSTRNNHNDATGKIINHASRDFEYCQIKRRRIVILINEVKWNYILQRRIHNIRASQPQPSSQVNIGVEIATLQDVARKTPPSTRHPELHAPCNICPSPRDNNNGQAWAISIKRTEVKPLSLRSENHKLEHFRHSSLHTSYASVLCAGKGASCSSSRNEADYHTKTTLRALFNAKTRRSNVKGT